jgi:hypothetical protein
MYIGKLIFCSPDALIKKTRDPKKFLGPVGVAIAVDSFGLCITHESLDKSCKIFISPFL